MGRLSYSRRALLLGASAAGFATVTGCAHAPRAEKQMALTFDDLPFVSEVEPAALAEARRTTSALTRTLRRHRAPSVAFVTEKRVQIDGQERERAALLQAWLDSGAVLGNHSFSHFDFNTVPVEQFSADVLRGAIVSDRLTHRTATEMRYFRFPYNHTGPTLEAKTAMAAFLTEHHYSVAPYTIDSADMTFNHVYRDALARDDEQAALRVREAYISFVLAATLFAEEITPRLFGRPIPHVLLMHANTLNADVLGDLLRALRVDGWGFISLDAAVADPAYQTPDTLVTRFGPTWLWRWRQSLRLNVSFAADPEPPAWITEAFTRLGGAPG